MSLFLAGTFAPSNDKDAAVSTSAEHWKALGRLIGYLKGKETKGIIIRKPKVLKAVMFYYSNYATYKDTRKSVSYLVTTLVGTLLTCSLKTQRTVMLSSTKSYYVALSACA